MVGQMWQMIIFGVTVMWSIYTTANKAIDLIAKEKLAEQQKAETNENT